MDEETGIGKTITTLVLLFVGIVVVSTVLIPLIFDMTGSAEGSSNIAYPDKDYTFTAYSNFSDAVFVFEGEAMEYLTVSEDGNSVSGRLPEGKHVLNVTAYTYQPTQVATMSVTIMSLPQDYADTRELILLTPTMMFVGMIVWGIRRFTGGSLGGDGGESHDGFSLGDSGIAGDFGRGFGKR